MAVSAPSDKRFRRAHVTPTRKRRWFAGPRQVVVALAGVQEALNGLDGHLGGDFTRLMAPHAVGDHKQAGRDVPEQCVLVIRADAARVCHTVCR